ncbi:MAG: hypothetical protein GYB32_00540 [Algicola sp.]|nr:hypothetical protein [Algicola sp.]
MKFSLIVIFVFLVTACHSSKHEIQAVEVSCGQCQFGLTSQKGCDLAIRIGENAYFVDGAHIDDFGDAHDKDSGFCEVIRKAEVSGSLQGDRFKIETIALTE